MGFKLMRIAVQNTFVVVDANCGDPPFSKSKSEPTLRVGGLCSPAHRHATRLASAQTRSHKRTLKRKQRTTAVVERLELKIQNLVDIIELKKFFIKLRDFEL